MIRTGQDSQKKSQGGNISPIWGEAPTVPIKTKICMAGKVNTAVKVSRGLLLEFLESLHIWRTICSNMKVVWA